MTVKPFLDLNFLLQNKVAEELYHDYAADLPIIDYHNHLPPDQIADNINFSNITNAWLSGDHYKWRAMRANGVDESYITGQASDKEKFIKWAETVPYTMRNPLYHWTHLELQRYFDISDLLSGNNATDIYDRTSERLQQPEFTTQSLLQKMKVEVVCTTDHPTDSLASHQRARSSDRNLMMLPTFRPDKFLTIDHSDFAEYLRKLETIVAYDISDYDSLVNALTDRIDFFHDLGCRLSDHGLSHLHRVSMDRSTLNHTLEAGRLGSEIDPQSAAQWQMSLLLDLARIYHSKDWTMQLHLGAIRNNNSRLMNTIGADVGADSIGDFDQAVGLSDFLNQLDREEKLSRTILYNLNPRDNEVFSTMAGNFNDGNIAGKIQWGSAWWFLDQKDGIERQLSALSQMGLLSRFIGMLTDSRSFLSFPRHEYFRRILCNLIGQDVTNGELPHDVKWLGETVQNICYYNAKRYFNFDSIDL